MTLPWQCNVWGGHFVSGASLHRECYRTLSYFNYSVQGRDGQPGLNGRDGCDGVPGPGEHQDIGLHGPPGPAGPQEWRSSVCAMGKNSMSYWT